MVNENCERCHISGEKAGLYDVIYEGKMGKLCERCSIIENIPIIKRPDSAKLKESEKGTDVYERMKRMTGYKEPTSETNILREQRIRELEKNPKLELPIKQQLNLMEHFHWEIMKNRRRKGLSHRQLAEAIGESEISVEMLEKGKLPENPEGVIKKLEQFFQISLRKITEADAMLIRKQKMIRTRPVLLDENGNELEHIPEPAVETHETEIYLETREILPEKKEIPWYKKILGRKKQTASSDSLESEDSTFAKESSEEKLMDMERETSVPGSRYLAYRKKEALRKGGVNEKDEKPRLELKEGEDLDLEKVDMSRIKISDLKEAHKKRVEVTKSEKILEQRKIEERQRLIEARKEELRAMKEKESKNIDKVLGGSELLKKDEDSDGFDESVEDFEDETL
jgi:ribosome-binding protein aMBF1 (putative translation factor)